MAGEVVGSGRDARVLDHGPGLVERRPWRPRDMTAEAEVMRWLTRHGYPSPRVVDVVDGGIVMERIPGPTMLASLTPRSLGRHMDTLAGLHARLHELPLPPGLTTPYGAGGTLLHGDLHPGNVVLSPDGPVVIDWTNACAGPAGADLAEAWLLLGCLGLPGRGLPRLAHRVARGAATRLLLRAAGRRASDGARAALPAVLGRRAADTNMSPVELAAMARLVRRHQPRG